MHWLGHFTIRPTQGPKILAQWVKILPAKYLEITGIIFIIQKSYESNWAIYVHRLGHFILGPQQGPKMARKYSQSFPRCISEESADFHDPKATGKLFGPNVAWLASFTPRAPKWVPEKRVQILSGTYSKGIWVGFHHAKPYESHLALYVLWLGSFTLDPKQGAHKGQTKI